MTIKVLASCACPGVADDNAIGIDHWHYEEVHSFPQLLSLLVASIEELDESFKHMGAVGFSRVHAASYQDILLLLRSLEVSDMQYWDIYA